MGFWETFFLLKGADTIIEAIDKAERAERMEAARLETERLAAEEEYEDEYTVEERFSVTMDTSFGEDEEAVRELLNRVKNNVSVDMTVFDKYGMIFKHNLVTDCDNLQLNMELINTRKLAEAMNKHDELTIKANVYDKNGNLLCIEELGFDYGMLKNGYAADYFYLSDENICDAHSIRVYALDPVDDEEVPETFVRRTVIEKEYTDEVFGEGEYIYCSVSFDKGGRTYYYRTEDESLKAGDEVIVTVGNQGKKSIGTIEKVERFSADNVPFPLKYTKNILGKCPY